VPLPPESLPGLRLAGFFLGPSPWAAIRGSWRLDAEGTMGKRDKDDEGRKAKGEGRDKGDASPRDGGLSKKDYEDLLEPLELQLNNLARWLSHSGKRLAVVVEGRDTAGKGGVIAAIADTLNPRLCRVVALPKPSERERTQWYFQRYVQHLPAAGEIVLFDRSWYNRAGVERVMGYCSEAEAQAFLKQTPTFEKLLVDDGLLLWKYWLTVDQDEQEKRFAERLQDPLKRWKLSPIDLQARAKYAEYGAAREAMLAATHSKHAPWTLVDFNDQRRGRLALIRHLLASVPDTDVPAAALDLPPLTHPPLKELFKSGCKPI
jgi:polyphosphate kinase 2